MEGAFEVLWSEVKMQFITERINILFGKLHIKKWSAAE